MESVHTAQRAFGPEQIACMRAAYEDALTALDLSDQQDPVTELVAKRIIEAAQTGERRPDRLREVALQGLAIAQAHE
jgi:hypothetical protein